MKKSQVKTVNSYIIRKMKAEAQLAKLEDELSPFVHASYEELITRKKKISLADMDKVQELGEKINKIQTDINFYESQIASSDLYESKFSYESFDVQRVNLN